ncbi:hypothetical protein cand_001570 [Cryptosporidium andersoni]|uniref:Uncharacterized protein n=1 Tax=Cryptosporidium andersoni TaxID=117008 RepID=A0A1J4MQE8_9CRYT|nr:hypothetical protein cand_001570 [Cryptosporidium andersoni]
MEFNDVKMNIVEEKMEENIQNKVPIKLEDEQNKYILGSNNNIGLNNEIYKSPVDFTKFEPSFFRRYVAFFSEDEKIRNLDILKDKEYYCKKINEHFSNLEINPVEVIRTFLVLKKISEYSNHYTGVSPAPSPEPGVLISENGKNSKDTSCKESITDPSIIDSNTNTISNSHYNEETYNSVINSLDYDNDNNTSTRVSRKSKAGGRGRR